MLTKTRVVLDYIGRESHYGRAAFGVIEDTASVTFLDLSPAAWDDMGNPTTITVTVEPGDLLNGDDD